MGKVIAIMRVMPESPDADLKKLDAALRKKFPGIQDSGIEPIAFGLKAIKVACVVEDEEGGTDYLERIFSEVPGVGRVETVDVNRMI